jgi:GDSL-like Lipase/Acylhydrolase family
MKKLLLPAAAAALFSIAGPACAQAPAAPPAIEFRTGDTVVLLGDTFLERDYNYAQLETLLTAAVRGKGVRFRNLGWSGDTPRCESRSYFGPPQEGFDRLKQQLTEIKPTLVVACYGAVDAFKGPSGHADFLSAYARQLDMIKDATGGARIVIMSPPPVSADANRWPSLAGHRAKQEAQRDALRAFAAERSLAFADLYAAAKDIPLETENGVAYTRADYARIAPAFVRSLALPLSEAALSSAQNNPALTTAVMEKNRLFFHRWRPQNEIYLFGSRKHEQGNNGVEIPMFDPLIAEKEKAVAAAAGAAK